MINAHEWMGLRAGVLAARRTGAPLVWTRSDETFWEQALMPEEGRFDQRSPVMRAARGAHGLADLWHARRADAIVVTSEHDAQMVTRAYRRQAHVLRQPPPAGFFSSPPRDVARSALGLTADDFFVFSFAIHQPYRRSEDLIEAAARLEDLPSLRVLIGGSDHEDPDYVRDLRALVDHARPGTAGRGSRRRDHRRRPAHPHGGGGRVRVRTAAAELRARTPGSARERYPRGRLHGRGRERTDRGSARSLRSSVKGP